MVSVVVLTVIAGVVCVFILTRRETRLKAVRIKREKPRR